MTGDQWVYVSLHIVLVEAGDCGCYLRPFDSVTLTSSVRNDEGPSLCRWWLVYIYTLYFTK